MSEESVHDNGEEAGATDGSRDASAFAMPGGFAGIGPFADVVISSRVRLARNLAGRVFTHRASPTQRLEILEACHEPVVAALAGAESGTPAWLRMDQAALVDKQLMLERHLVSREMARRDRSVARAVGATPSGALSVMVNEEDHLRLQALRPGFALEETFAAADGLDDALADKLGFAWSRRFGFLTACPTNIGTGVRLGVLLHLPAMAASGEIQKLKNLARDLGLALRGAYGEGSEPAGDLWQVSNQATLGRTEREILADFSGQVVPQIVAYERQARQALARCRPLWMEDQTRRAFATLTSARLLSTDEALLLLSRLRLARHVGGLAQVSKVSDGQLARLMFVVQPAHLQKAVGKDLGPAARREVRAELVREALMGG